MLNWHNIRTYNHSQNSAFEEFVCQLARHDAADGYKRFFRLGTPDGGVECYWLMQDGNEIGWQAKYVFSIEALISQVDSSIKTAVENHPLLVRYIVAAPFCLPDPHYTKNEKPIKSAKEKWEDKVRVWQDDFATKGRVVDIVLWDESYLVDALSKPENEGMRYFWFNGHEFTHSWFKEKVESTIRDLGPRYTSELNIELDIADSFNYILMNEYSYKIIKKYQYDLANAIEEVSRESRAYAETQVIMDEINSLSETAARLFELLDFTESMYRGMCPINIKGIVECIDSLEEFHSNIWNSLEQKHGEKEYRRSSMYHTLNNFFDKLNDGKSLFSEQSYMLNYPFMILHGDPGVGKSHLLADVCVKLLDRNYPCAIMLGEQFFAATDPREQIKQYFQFTGSFSSLLQILNTIGQLYGQRFLLAIDALNEGSGNILWKRFLAGLENDISRYPWIALVVSVRDDYLQDVIPEKCRESMICVQHTGFEEIYDFVCDEFFRYYGIDFGLPIFNAEFANPLFLKLFCESCQEDGYPQSLPSLSGIFIHFLQHINNKLHLAFRYEPALDLPTVSLKCLAKALLQGDVYSIPYSEFHELLESTIGLSLGIKSTDEYYSFLDALIREGLLRTHISYRDEQKYIGFAYDRMRDYYILLEKINEKPVDIDIIDYIKTSAHFEKVWDTKGFGKESSINLLSILLPELFEVELVECAPEDKVSFYILDGLLKSFQWRDVVKESAKIADWLIEIAKKNNDNKLRIIDELLHVAAVPNHPFNMDFIHSNFLYPESITQIDSWWTPHINQKYDDYQNNIYKRLVKWCWNIEHRANMEVDSRRLIGMTLSWFFSATNRALRDCSTKGMVCLYMNHLEELPLLLNQFIEVSDIYITERLYAGAYGASLHSQDKAELKILSDYILKHVFETEEVIPHILIRDYARNIIEYSIIQGNYSVFERTGVHARITPPYKSEMPSAYPSDADIKALEEKYSDSSGFDCICDSLDTSMNYGDFGRYVFKDRLNEFVGVEINPLRNWCIAHIVDMGYDPDLHDKKSTPYTGRGSNRVERIGKKYQWMAFHELLARVSDNYLLTDDSWPEQKTVPYSGPWGPNTRDIDPSLLISQKTGLNYHQPEKSWFSGSSYISTESNAEQWIQEPVSEPEKLISTTDNHGIEWLYLCYYPFWNEYPAAFKEPKNRQAKSMRGYIYSFITERKNEEKIWELSKSSRKTVRDALANINWYTVFDKEYYWSPAYSEAARASSGIGWTKITDDINILQTTQRFLWEEEYDFSKEDTIAYDIPVDFVCAGMSMTSKRIPAHYYHDDQLVCFNPSILDEANHSLLIRKDALIDWLEKANLSIVWMVTMEKYVNSGSLSDTKLWSDYHGAYHIVDGVIEGNIQWVDGKLKNSTDVSL